MKLVDNILADNCYFKAETPKDSVVLHFTAGPSAKGAIATFQSSPRANGYPVSTPYVVEVDGTIYKIFEDKYWSYHLGVQGPQAENHKHDKRSVAIEIANVGPLRPHGGEALGYWPNNFKSKYCLLTETTKYVKLPSKWRNEEYFATFPQAQIDAVLELVESICEAHRIPKILPPPSVRHSFDLERFKEYRGVLSHVNFRPDKTDLAPLQSDALYANLIARGFTEVA